MAVRLYPETLEWLTLLCPLPNAVINNTAVMVYTSTMVRGLYQYDSTRLAPFPFFRPYVFLDNIASTSCYEFLFDCFRFTIS